MTRSRCRARVLPALVLVSLIGSPSTAGATEWWVAPGGSGSGTYAAPFGRIQDGLNAAQPGDVVTVRPGTYLESIFTVRAAAAGTPILLRAEQAGSSIITAAGTVLQVSHAYHVVDGLVFDGQYGANFTVRVSTAASSLVLRNSEVRRSGRDCVVLGAPGNVLIENSRIHHCLNSTNGRTDAHGIAPGAARNLTIRGTEIHTFSGDGIQIDPGRAAPGWDELTIEGSRFWLAPLGQPENGFPAGVVPGENAVDTKVYAAGPRARIVIRDTLAWGFKNGMVGNMAAFNIKETVDATLDRVTVWDSEIAFRLRGPAWVKVMNAVMHHVSYGIRYEDNIPVLRVWNTTFGSGVTQPFIAAASGQTGLQVRNVLLLGAILPSEAADASNRAVSASSFINAAANDYHLAAGSPAIDVGVSIAEVQTDRDGVSRPRGTAYDVGAYEYCPNSCTETANWVYPTDGAANVDLSRPLEWTSVPNVQAYYLWVGSAPGGKDLINTGEIQQTTYDGSALPASMTVYATIWTKVGNVWRSSAISFTTPARTAAFTYPTDAAADVDVYTRALAWTSVPYVQAYYLWVGTTPGAKDLVNTGEIQQTSYLASSLPPTQTVYATIWAKVSGVWRSSAISFTTAAVSAVFTSPSNGAVDVDTSQPLTWTSVPLAQAYYLWVGDAPWGQNLINSGEMQGTSYPALSLPENRTVYAAIWTRVGGVWRASQITFTTARLRATFIQPTDGAVNVDRTQPLTWTSVPRVQAYYLWVGDAPWGQNLINTGEIQGTSYPASSLPANRTVYAAIWTKVGGVWRASQITFTTAP